MTVMRQERRVVAYRDPELGYPTQPPFDPPEAYPEYGFGPSKACGNNSIYGAVRQVLALSGLDAGRFGMADWNPLGELVGPGGTVLIKPNWVRHYHPRGDDLFSIITHTAVLRPLADYAFRAVGPAGRVWIMDAPLADTDYEALRRACGLDAFERALRDRGMPLEVADLRSLVTEVDHGVVVKRTRRNTWASEGVEFDLGPNSELAGLGPTLRNVFGSDYDRRVTSAFHSVEGGDRQRHYYRVSRRVLDANLIISVPKLKTHKKTGISLNIKNMIGANTDKNYIPHYRVGSPSQGGDEFPDTGDRITRARRRMVRTAVDLLLGRSGRVGEGAAYLFMRFWLPLNARRLARETGHPIDPVDVFYRTVQGDLYRTGNWWGNDTCWRCAVDIARIVLYGRIDGYLGAVPARGFFSVVDGIVGGEGDGPLAPTARREGVLIAGFDPVSVDRVAAEVMGFDPDCFRDLRPAAESVRTDQPLHLLSNWPAWEGQVATGSGLGFRPPPGWASVLERDG